MAMCDIAYEAQACYSLGNTYTLMKDFSKAIEYHSKHLCYAIQLRDRYAMSAPTLHHVYVLCSELESVVHTGVWEMLTWHSEITNRLAPSQPST